MDVEIVDALRRRFTTLPSAEGTLGSPWPDYVATLGLSSFDVPALIRLATELEATDFAPDDPNVWVPVHAWRSLGQLRAQEAAEPLVKRLREDMDDDWSQEELPRVLSMIGGASEPGLSALLQDEAADLYARAAAARGLTEIAQADPTLRPGVVSVITRVLESFETNDPDLNGFLIGNLTDLRAEEALPLMQRAFEAETVDEMVIDWEYVQIKFGLLSPSQSPRHQELLLYRRERENARLAAANEARHQQRVAAKAKAKRKASKQARKKSRR